MEEVQNGRLRNSENQLQLARRLDDFREEVLKIDWKLVKRHVLIQSVDT